MQNAKWIGPVRFIVGIAFVFFGLIKFINPEMQQPMFEPYPSFFMPLIGVLEIAGGAALLANKATRWAALGLAVIMVGAVATHFIVGISPQVTPAVVLLVLNALLFTKSSSDGARATA